MIDRIDDVQRNVGRITDASDPNGSVNAKLAAILGRLPVGILNVTAVQYGTVTITDALSATATIGTVDTTRSIVIPLGTSTNDVDLAQIHEVRLALSNATTVTATREQAGSGETTITAFVVVTFAVGVTVQTGTFTIAAASATGTATITSVDTTKSVLVLLGSSMSGSPTSPSWMRRITLTNATTITGTRSGTTNQVTVSYAVVTFP